MNAAPVLTSVEHYDQNPSRQAALLRSLLAEDQNGFLEAIADVSVADSGNRGLRYAMILLNNSGVLIPYLADSRRSSLQRASKLARLMVGIDHDFSNELLRKLEARDPLLESDDRRLRILDLILEIGGGLTNWRALARLSASDDQRIRIRCVNIFAKYRADSKTLAAIYDRSDARTRADMVEVLCADNQRDTGTVMSKALGDENNRVATNACVAAYRTGDARSLQSLDGMLAADQSPLFRTSAVWAMGETKDPRFGEALRIASKSSDAKLRASALRSLTKLERLTGWETNPSFKILSDFETPCCTDRSADVVRTIVVHRQGDAGGLSRVRDIDYMLYRGAVPILRYTVRPPSKPALVSLRMACSVTVLEEFSSSVLEKLTARNSRVRLDCIAVYGPPNQEASALIEKNTGLKCTWVDSLRQAVGRLLDTSGDQSPFELCTIVDPVFPIELPLFDLEQECMKASIGFYAVEFDRGAASTGLSSFFPGEGAAFIEKYCRGLASGTRIQFSGPLSGVSLRIRQPYDSGTSVSQTLEWR